MEENYDVLRETVDQSCVVRGVGKGNYFLYRGVWSPFDYVSRVIDEH